MEEVASELARYKIGVAAVQEIRWKDSGIIRKRDYDFHFSGSEEARGHKGVGFFVMRDLKQSVLGFEPISDRMCKLRIKGKFCNITFVNIYAPTEDAEEELVEDFYAELEKVCDKIPRHDMKVVLGDFNARIGKEDHNQAVAGKYGLHEETSMNGERVCMFAEAQRLIISSTCFPHKNIHLGTWNSPGRMICNQIDHVLTSKRWATSIIDVKACRGANCDSDHYLVKGVLRHRLANAPRKNSSKSIRWQIEKLAYQEVRTQYLTAVEGKLATRIEGQSIEEKWDSLKNVVNCAAEEVVGKTKRQRNTDWFDEQCRMALKVKNEARRKLIQVCTRANSEDYRKKRVEANRLMRRKKREAENKRIEIIEQNNSLKECRKFYKNTRNFTETFQAKTQICLDSTGTVLIEDAEIRKRWKEYFEDLFKAQDSPLPDNAIDIPIFVDREVQMPQERETADIINKIKNFKAAGTDRITGEMLKYGGETLWKEVHKLIAQIWEEEMMPEEWKQGLIIPIYKKGDKRVCKNYRGITLLNVTYKVFSILIYNRLVEYGENTIGEYQCGFRAGRSTMDNIFMVRQAFEKCTEFNTDLHCVFVDFKQAFDKVNRERMLEGLRFLGVPQKIIRLVKLTLDGSKAVVRIMSEETDPFQVEAGVRQGDSLSALLFNLVLETALRNVDCEGDISYRMTQITAYADDIAIIGRNKRVMIEKLQEVEREVRKVGLMINWDKTKYMKMTRGRPEGRAELEVNGKQIENVNMFKYLGSTLTTDNKVSEEIKRRIAAGGRCYFAYKRLFSSNILHKESKLRIYKTVIRPVVVYGCEAWTLTKQDTDRLRIFERRALRRIYGPECRQGVWQRRKNKDLLEALNGEDIVRLIKAQRIRWLGHISRMSETRLVKKIEGWTPASTRPRGRPRKRWKDDVLDDLRKMGFRNWREEVEDRVLWRQIVQQAKTHGGL